MKRFPAPWIWLAAFILACCWLGFDLRIASADSETPPRLVVFEAFLRPT